MLDITILSISLRENDNSSPILLPICLNIKFKSIPNNLKLETEPSDNFPLASEIVFPTSFKF